MSTCETVVAERAEFVAALKTRIDALKPGETARIAIEADGDLIRSLLRTMGLHQIREYQPAIPVPGVTYLQGTKLDLSPVANVVAIMSLPRYGLCSNFGTVTRALTPLGIPLEQGFGVYWSEVMTHMMSSLNERCVEFVLAIDYDSVFEASDVMRLVRLMEKTPDAGAICGTQMRRTRCEPLLTTEDGVTFDREMTEARTAHFGLTLIRTSALRQISRPWFQAVPDGDGEWKIEKGSVAADVAFWLKFTSEGQKLYQANSVAVGHIEEMIIWPSRELEPVVQSMEEYRDQGMPSEVIRA